MDDRDSTIAVLEKIGNTPLGEIDLNSPGVRELLDRLLRRAANDDAVDVARFGSAV